MLGNQPPAQPGDLIPDTYLDLDGCSRQVDFGRLVELGAAEAVNETPAKAKLRVAE
jgi:hypothetical protein